MNTLKTQWKIAHIRRRLQNICQRFSAVSLLVTLVFVAPAIASLNHASLDKVRIPRIDARAFENLQRRINEENETWAEEA